MIDEQPIHQKNQRNVLIYHMKSPPKLAALHAFPMLHPLDSRRANC